MTAEDDARAAVRARCDDLCELCGRRPATDWHHRLPRSAGGPWSASNGLGLCRFCHDLVGTHPRVAYRHGWLVERGMDPGTVPVLLMTEHGELSVLLRDDGSMGYDGGEGERCLGYAR